MVKDIETAVELLRDSGAIFWEISGKNTKIKMPETLENVDKQQAAINSFTITCERLESGVYNCAFKTKEADNTSKQNFNFHLKNPASDSSIGAVSIQNQQTQSAINTAQFDEILKLTRENEALKSDLKIQALQSQLDSLSNQINAKEKTGISGIGNPDAWLGVIREVRGAVHDYGLYQLQKTGANTSQQTTPNQPKKNPDMAAESLNNSLSDMAKNIGVERLTKMMELLSERAKSNPEQVEILESFLTQKS